LPAQIEEKVNRLREKGQKQGFLTEQEFVNALHAEPELDADAIETIIEQIEEGEEVALLRKPPVALNAERNASHGEMTPAMVELEESAQAWLRRAGKVALLTHEQEISLAKRMENPRSLRDEELAARWPDPVPILDCDCCRSPSICR